MATEVNLPELGESVTEGTVTRWLKQVGDAVAVDEPLLEVSTDKVDTEIPSPVAGTLLEIKANEDDTVEVGAVLAMIGSADESGGGDGGGESGGDEQSEQAQPEQAQPVQAEAEPEPEPEPQPEEQQEQEQPAETPLDEERVERGEAHDQAEQEATPGQEAPQQAEQAEQAEQADTQDEAPREEVAAATSGASRSSGEQTVVRLPELGESVTEGTVTRWLKQVGDEVAADESLLEVSTDKVDTEIPSPAAGTLLEIKVNEDETVEVGAELAVIGSGQAPAGDGGQAAPTEPEAEQKQAEEQPAEEQEQEQAAEAAPEAEAEPQPESAPEPEVPEQPAAHATPAAPSAEAAGEPSGGRDSSAYVTPLVRKMAAQHGVDLADIVGTGVGGRIRKQDVLDAAQKQGKDTAPTRPAAAAAAAAQPEQPAPAAPTAPAPGAPVPSPLRGKTEPMTRLRKVIAQRMVESLHVSAQLTTVVEVDVTSISRLRDSVKADFAAREGVKLSFMPFFAKAAIDALKAHPSLNAAIDTEKGEVTYFDVENLAIAVDTERGLLTPVIKEAGDLSIAGLARKIADVAERTRTNKITPDELSGGTFTLTNTGSRGALFDTPIINQPQVAILGTGAVVKRPVVIDDPNLGETIAVRQMVYFALTYDHRLVDGADAARFLSEVKARLEAGQFEV
ncbi:MAG TPA: 2-oxoglutarate dehydrogenase, E2 component, dihydrolipoamide succinyltransferase [Nocardioides sp.]|uniref:2-oxoglutarate dehydrogenase, E2 component, dihydrolipoamide succinyltransferase n=1 Tax=Nocardioides sp. TaxID=35761 RepID=UPI002F3E51BB